MAVYVDDMRAAFGRMKMCHMIADSRRELDEMADRIGVARRWIQMAGTYREHYDVCLEKRTLAIQYGAQTISQHALATRLLNRTERGRRLLARKEGGSTGEAEGR